MRRNKKETRKKQERNKKETRKKQERNKKETRKKVTCLMLVLLFVLINM